MGWMSAIGDIAGGAMKDMGLGDPFNSATSAGDAAGGGGNWWEKGIEKAMPSIMGAAMKPKQQMRAPAAAAPGHTVQANASTAMQPFNEVTKMADDNPLAGIHQWSNLFG